MKTTIELDDRLFAELKRCAAAEGVSMKSVVHEAIRARIDRARTAAPAKRFRFRPVVVEGTRPPAVDVADRRALVDFMEATESK